MPPSPGYEDDLLELLISEERHKLPAELFVDFGEPLPLRYGVDQLQLMVQSPFRVFAHWELTEASIQEALQRFPDEDRPTFQVLSRWIEADGQVERFLDVGTTSSWWFPTVPEERYQLQLGLYSEECGWVPLLISPEVVTPRITLGPPPERVEESEQTVALLEELVQWTGITAPSELVERREAIPETEIETAQEPAWAAPSLEDEKIPSAWQEVSPRPPDEGTPEWAIRPTSSFEWC